MTRNSNPNPHRIGLMGYGKVASYGHVPAILDTPELELSAVFDPDPQRLAPLAERVGASALCTDVDTFFGKELDAIVVTSPAPRHHENVLAAAERGMTVLCEKPLAMSAEEAHAMIQACDNAGVRLYVAYCYRFSDVSTTIRRCIAEGLIGDLKLMRLIYNWDLHGMYVDRDSQRGEIDPRWLGRMLEGGPMVDCGVHQIDLCQVWAQSPITDVKGVGVWVEDYEYPDQLWGHLTHDNGVHTCVEMSSTNGHTARTAESNFRYEIRGTRGVIVFDRGENRFELKNDEGDQAFDMVNEKDFNGMYRAFAESLSTGEIGDMCPATQGMVNTDIAWQIVDAAMRDQPSNQQPLA
ncbi:MAG: Gfo/Idh/MocA family oxidoreductase [Planctomycetota bacterium]